MDELEKARRDLAEAMEEWKRNGTLSDQTLQKLTRAQKTLTDATEDQTDATEEATKNLKKFYNATKDVISQFGTTAQGIRENRENFEALNPAIRGTGTIVAAGGKAIGGGLEQLGKSIAVGSAAFLNLPGVIAGAGINVLGRALGGVAEEATKAGIAFMEFSTGELNRVTGAFRQLGSVGAITSGGMDQLYASSIQAGLSVSQFAGLVAQNAQGLAFATGSSTESAQAIAEITQAAKPFQDQLLALGFGLEQQSEVFADYIVMSRRLGRQQTRDYATLAEGAAEYAFELDELSRLTGMSRQEAQKALEAQLSNTRFRATLAKAEATGGQDLVKAIRGTAAGVEAFGDKRLAEGFQDAFGGLGTEAARQFEFATGGLGRQIVEDLRAERITQDQALEQIQRSIQGKLQSMGGLDFIERVGKLGTFTDPMLLGMIEFSQRAGVTAEDMEKLRNEQQKSRKSLGDGTKSVIDALKAMQGAAMSLDQLVKDQVFPNAASAVKTFTQVMEGAIKVLLDLAPGVEVKGERAKGGPVSGGDPYLVGEQGPELFSPGAPGQITNADITGKLAAIAQGGKLTDSGYGSATGVPGFKETFMPGIGKVTQYNNEGLQKTIIEGVNGAIEEYSAFVMGGLTQEMYSSGGQNYQRMSSMYGDTTATTNFVPSGPRSYYNSIMDNVRPQDLRIEQAYTEMLDDDGTGRPGQRRVDVDVTDQVSSKQLMEVFSAMTAEMQKIAANTKTGADTNKQILRVASS